MMELHRQRSELIRNLSKAFGLSKNEATEYFDRKMRISVASLIPYGASLAYFATDKCVVCGKDACELSKLKGYQRMCFLHFTQWQCVSLD